MLAFLAAGYLLGDSAPWALASLILLPFFSRVLEGPAVVSGLAVCMLAVTVVKRLEANRRPLPQDKPERRKVLLRRLFLDRDIRSHREWIRRKR